MGGRLMLADHMECLGLCLRVPRNGLRLVLFVISVLGAILETLGADANADWNRNRRVEELKTRDGIGNFMSKISAGKDVVVAYIGGSITCGDTSWRAKTTKWLRKTYPKVRITEINAALGGTDSSLGVFRYDEDVLSKNPDLVLIEFACNDTGLDIPTSRRSMEGMVRKTWKRNPTTDIVFTYVICSYMTNDYCRGFYPRGASVHEEIAERYGIPSVCFGVRVANLCSHNAIVMRAAELSPSLREMSSKLKFPTEGDYEGKSGTKRGRPIFSFDGVHPTPDGHQLYATCMRDAFRSLDGRSGVHHGKRIEEPMFDGDYEFAKWFYVPTDALKGEGWKPFTVPDGGRAWSRLRGKDVQLFRTDTAGDGIKFRFRGTRCGLYGLFGPNGAKIEVRIDGVRTRRDIDLFDMYSSYYRFCPVTLFEGKDGLHDVEVRLSSELPDRIKLGAPRIKYEDLKNAIYDGSALIVSRLTMLGDLVKDTPACAGEGNEQRRAD